MAEELLELGAPGPLRDRLVAAVLAGEKTATSSLLVDYADGEVLPRPGDRCVLVDSASDPVALVELVEVRIIRLADADLQLARDEGEGFSSVAEWRAAHEAFWNTAGRPHGAAVDPLQIDDDTQVVVEWFRVASRL